MTIQTEVVIVGAGPCGLFQVFELGLLGMKAHLLDSLAKPGGQCAELYPEKPIYDIPALPSVGAQELIDRLLEQIKPFGAAMHFGHEVTVVHKRDDGRFDVETAGGLKLDAGAVIIAGGVGSFQPRRLGVEGVEKFEGTQIFYRVRAAAEFHGKRLVIFGGGDSALDWTLALVDKATSVTLVHRRSEFRAAPASVAKMQELVAAGKMRFIEGTAQALISAGDVMNGVRVKDSGGVEHELPADRLLAFFGLAPKLGPIAAWGLDVG
jgi:thioredoxin reductase (NADPH)